MLRLSASISMLDPMLSSVTSGATAGAACW